MLGPLARRLAPESCRTSCSCERPRCRGACAVPARRVAAAAAGDALATLCGADDRAGRSDTSFRVINEQSKRDMTP